MPVATRAAPTSPIVLGTEEPIDDPFSVINVASSPLYESTAMRLDLPARTINVLPAEVCAISLFTMSATVRRGLVEERLLNVMRERAKDVLAVCDIDGKVYRSQRRLSAVSDTRRVCVVCWPYTVSAAAIVSRMVIKSKRAKEVYKVNVPS